MNECELVEDIYPLTPLQQGMLFHSLLAPGTGTYWEQLSVTLAGPLDAARFKQAWRDAIARHAALRTEFHWEELDEPLQIARPEVPLVWVEEDWSSLTPADFEQRLAELRATDRAQGCRLDEAPLMRFYLLRGPGASHTFLWCHHHILLDGWSAAIVFRDVVAGCQQPGSGRPVLPPPPRSFRDYVLWLREQPKAAAQAYWQAHLEGLPGPTTVRVGPQAARTAGLARHYRQQQVATAPATRDALHELVKRERMTMNAVIQGAWALLLSHYSGEFDVVFGTVVSSRPPELRGAQDMVGLLINTVPVRVRFNPEANVTDWLRELHEAQVQRAAHATAALPDILAWSGQPAETPLFDSILSYENFPVDAALQDADRGLQIREVAAVEETNYALAVVVGSDARSITLKITADADRFSPEALAAMLEHFRNLLEQMARSPKTRLRDLKLDPSPAAPLVPGAAVAIPDPAAPGISRWFEAQVCCRPNAVAVRDENGVLTYQELNQRANQLARYLVAKGTVLEELVGICAQRSTAQVVAILAVLKAGGAYVPLDPGYPAERLGFIAADAGARLVLADAAGAAVLRGENRGANPPDLIHLENEAAPWAEYPTDDLAEGPAAENLAYAIYTSGSTGRPKGALIEHRALLNHMRWMIDEFKFEASVRVLQKTPFSFDASVWEYYLPLLCGGELVLARPDGHQDPEYLAAVIQAQTVTVLQGVPSLLELLASTDAFGACPSLTHVFSGGEVLTTALVARLRQRTTAVICNLYGPTETCIDATFHVCPPDHAQPGADFVPIGRPLPNLVVEVRDAWGHAAPVGVAGELWIGGAGLARGYCQRPDLTREKFVVEAGSGRRFYRTGDLVQWRADGVLNYLGRADEQVKLRGYRIEPGEIEAVLELHPHVSRAAVVVVAVANAGSRLVAYVSVYTPAEGLDEALLEHARRFLPEHMIPAQCLVLAELPSTPSGKIDRRQLAARPIAAVAVADGEPPRTATEQMVAAVWGEVLNRENISREDNFFLLGGHSLSATQVLSRLRERGQVALPLRALFECPVLRELARRMETLQAAAAGARGAGQAGSEAGEVEELSI